MSLFVIFICLFSENSTLRMVGPDSEAVFQPTMRRRETQELVFPGSLSTAWLAGLIKNKTPCQVVKASWRCLHHSKHLEDVLGHWKHLQDVLRHPKDVFKTSFLYVEFHDTEARWWIHLWRRVGVGIYILRTQRVSKRTSSRRWGDLLM